MGGAFSLQTMAKLDEKIELSKTVFENLRSLISHADGKAGIALGLQTFFATSVLGSTVVSEFLKHISVLDWRGRAFYYVLLASFVAVSILGIVFCISVFTPRPPQEESEKKRAGLTYFGHIKSYESSKEYLTAITNSTDSDVITDIVCQNYTLAWIVDHKMRFSRYSVRSLLLSIFLGILLLFFALMTK